MPLKPVLLIDQDSDIFSGTARRSYRPKQNSSSLSISKAAVSMMGKECATCGQQSSGWGFKPAGQALKWFCGQHKADGERYLKNLA